MTKSNRVTASKTKAISNEIDFLLSSLNRTTNATQRELIKDDLVKCRNTLVVLRK